MARLNIAIAAYVLSTLQTYNTQATRLHEFNIHRFKVGLNTRLVQWYNTSWSHVLKAFILCDIDVEHRLTV